MKNSKYKREQAHGAMKAKSECEATLRDPNASSEDKAWAQIGLDECLKFFANN